MLGTRSSLQSVTEAVMFPALQGLAFRGHREGELTDGVRNTNRGNFKELMSLIGRHNSIVKSKLTGMKNASHTHSDIQNCLIQKMSTMVREEISSEISASGGTFSLQCDESKDISKTEQINIVVRYEKNCQPTEELLDIVPAERLTAVDLAAVIVRVLTLHKIDIKRCCGQTYDGAAVMSGIRNGAWSPQKDSRVSPSRILYAQFQPQVEPSHG